MIIALIPIALIFSLHFILILSGENSCWPLTVPRVCAVMGVGCVVNLRQTLGVHLVSTLGGGGGCFNEASGIDLMLRHLFS